MNKSFQDLIDDKIQNRISAGLTVLNQDDKAVVRIYDVIGWPFITAENIARELDSIDADEIEVQINSPGGNVFDSVAIYNSLRSHPARITTRIDGLAASGASIIAQAGDQRVMLSGAQMMIHEAWGMTQGFEEDHRATADVLAKLSGNIANVYAEASSGDVSKFADLMSNETWFDADEAVAAGLADEVVKPDKNTQLEIDPPNKFADELSEAVASWEKVAARAEDVITFRSEQGKPPLSDEAVALISQVRESLNRLEAEPEQEADTLTVSDRKRHLDLIDSENEVASQLLEI